jgi:eukaryotic-like serine/threonine-protein kinase
LTSRAISQHPPSWRSSPSRANFRYEIVRKIFEGGMGIVYEAEQHGARNFVKRVAIKIIRPNFASQKMFIENFIGEAKLVADLIHTNIVQTYHLGRGQRRGVSSPWN